MQHVAIGGPPRAGRGVDVDDEIAKNLQADALAKCLMAYSTDCDIATVSNAVMIPGIENQWKQVKTYSSRKKRVAHQKPDRALRACGPRDPRERDLSSRE